MSTFKITNITHLLGKREAKYNSIVNIEYVDKMTKKVINIKPNNTVYINFQTLPISAHNLRVKNLITVLEISDAELSVAISNSTTNSNTNTKPSNDTNLKHVEEAPKQIKKAVIKKEKEDVID